MNSKTKLINALVTATVLTTSTLLAEEVPLNPVLTFGNTRQLNTKPIEKISPQEFSLSDDAKIKHMDIEQDILNGNILDAKEKAQVFLNEAEILAIKNTFETPISHNLDIEKAVALLDVSTVERAMGDKTKAALYAEKALIILNNYPKKYPTDYLLGLTKILPAMRDVGMHDLADRYTLTYMRSAHTLFRNRMISGVYTLQEAYENLNKNGNTFATKFFYGVNAAKEIFAVDPGIASIEYISTGFAKADYFMNKANYLKVISVVEETRKELSVAIEKKYPKNQIFADLAIVAGQAQVGMFQYNKAIKEFEYALKFCQDTIGENAVKTALVYRELAIAQKYGNQEKKDLAIANINKAVEIMKGIKGNDNIEMVNYYMTQGGVYMEAEKPEEAVAALENARRVNVMHRGTFNNITKIIDSNIKYAKMAADIKWRD